MSCYGKNNFDFIPYPSADGVKPDKKMAKRLCDSYAGEMSSVNYYLYYSLIFEDSFPDLAGMFEHLAEVEMIHVRLISECIKKLGINPAFRIQLSNSPVSDDPSHAPAEAGRCIERSAHDETSACEEYRALGSFTCDNALRAILERLASDEEEHRKILESFCI